MSTQQPQSLESATVHITKMSTTTADVTENVDWLSRMMMTGLEGAEVLSAEIVPPIDGGDAQWTLVQRFYSAAEVERWLQSESRRKLLEEIAPKLDKNEIALSETMDASYGSAGSVAVAIVTHIKPGQEREYCECERNFQTAQTKYPGYRGAYLQPPTRGTPGIWTTLTRFDCPASLDKWLSSSERKKLLERSEQIVSSTDYQMVGTSFPGWFGSQGAGAKGPPNWKTAMLILLGLYPIVMLEIRYLMPMLHGLDAAVANFTGNIISCALTTWVTMPICIKIFNSWLFPSSSTPKWSNSAGIMILICLYAIEIALLWRLL
jgi:antibiotic biosynthesis monooxygenase (ABM) superfamily enzyme